MLVAIAQMTLIQKIFRDETWYEGERRGHFVDQHDPVVADHVADIIKIVGEKMRSDTLNRMKCETGFATENDKTCHGCIHLNKSECGCRCMNTGESIDPENRLDDCIKVGRKE